MIILNPGNSATLTLSAYDKLSIKTRDSVRLDTLNAGGAVISTSTVTGEKVFGQELTGSVQITAIGGDCYYGVVPASDDVRAATDASGYVGSPSDAIRNFTLANTVNLRKIRAGGVRGRILAIGDSFTSGHGSGGNGLLGQKRGAFAPKLAVMLTGAGVPALADYAVGTGTATSGVTAANLASYDPRLSFTGASTLDGYPTLGGMMMAMTSAGDKITFTPGDSFDTVVLLFARNTTGQGDFTVSVDGGTTTAATIVNNNATDVALTEVAVPAGSRAVTLSKGAGSSYIIAIGTRNSVKPGIEIINAGISGGQVATLAVAAGTGSAYWNTRACIPKILDANAVNVTLINGWYNDRGASRTVPQVRADLTTLINTAKAYGDVIYVCYPALSTANISAANFATYNDAAIEAAIAAGIPVVDTSKLIPDQAAGNAVGLYADNLHLNNAGYAYPAALLKAAILGNIS